MASQVEVIFYARKFVSHHQYPCYRDKTTHKNESEADGIRTHDLLRDRETR